MDRRQMVGAGPYRRSRSRASLTVVAVFCLLALEGRAQAPASIRTVTVEGVRVEATGYDQDVTGNFALSQRVSLANMTSWWIEGLLVAVDRRGGGCDAVDLELTLLDGDDEVVALGRIELVRVCVERLELVFRIPPPLPVANNAASVDTLRLTIANRRLQDGGTEITSSFSGLFPRDALRLHFVPDQDPDPVAVRSHQGRDLYRVSEKSLSGDDEISPWSGFAFDQPVPLAHLRFAVGGFVLCRAPGAPLAGMESQFVLEDGSFLALDDWNAPSTGGPPTVRSTCRNSLLLDDEQRAALRDRSIVGWRWRIHKPGAGGTFEAGPLLDGMGLPRPMGLPFYYDCDVRSNPPELAADCNENGIADGCEADCNRNGVPDDCDLRDGTSTDCDQNSLPDECDILPGKIDLAPAAEIRQVPEPANAVIALDLDGDDVPDLAVADGAPSVSVLLGTGGGAFGRPAVVPVGFPPEILVAADLDRDGAPDLIATRSGGFVPEQRVALLRNRGNGTFADPVMVEVAERPTTLVATDLNGDGAPDLVTGHRDLATLTVLLNDGSLAFSVAESPTLEEPAVSLAPLDLDGDGDRDLIAATGQRLTLLTNDGSGGLSVERTIELAFVPEIVGAADLDGDGRLDLVLGQAEPAVAHVMLGAAGGGFADPVAYGFHATTRDSDATPTADVETADVDGDGSLDLVMVSSLVRAATVMRGEGDGTFGVPENFPVGDPAAEIWEAALAVADIDVDGALDVVVALRSVDTFLLRNRSLPPSIVDCNANGIPDRCEIDSEPQVDSDGDGILDECVPVPFARADANSDGNVDLSDPVAILGYLFLGAPPPSCLTSADADDNGVVDLTDAIRLLNFLFLGGPRPAAPFGECGTDPTPDDLTCESFDGCP